MFCICSSVGLGTVYQTSPSVIPTPNLSTKVGLETPENHSTFSPQLGSYPGSNSPPQSRALHPIENHPQIDARASFKETRSSKPTIAKRVFIESTGFATLVSRKLTLLFKVTV